MAYLTPEEIRAEKIKAMGDELGQLHYDLWNEVTLLHHKWHQFKTLEASPERINILNKTAPAFFRMLQQVLFDDVLLHISKLTDPSESRIGSKLTRDNLTMLRLKNIAVNPEIKGEVDRLLEIISTKVASVRKHRHRRIGHLDLHTLHKLDPLPPATRQHVNEALEAMCALMNCIQQYYQQSEAFYDHVITRGDAEALIFFLERGVRVIDEERQHRSKKLR